MDWWDSFWYGKKTPSTTVTYTYEQDQTAQNNSNNSNNPSHFEVHQRSYSTSRSCYSDPEDPQYMICKDNVNDGTNTSTNETRVKASEYLGGGGPLGSPFDMFFGSNGMGKGAWHDGMNSWEND
jgi:hypothetical protein